MTEVNRKVSEYENRIALLSQEMERVNGNLRIKTEEVMSWESRNREWETKWARITQDNEELRRRLNDLGELNRKIAEYENKIALLTQEIERLNGNLRIKVEEVSSWESKHRSLIQETEVLKRRNNEFEVTITQQWESKWTRITQENEELRMRLV